MLPCSLVSSNFPHKHNLSYYLSSAAQAANQQDQVSLGGYYASALIPMSQVYHTLGPQAVGNHIYPHQAAQCKPRVPETFAPTVLHRETTQSQCLSTSVAA